MAGPKPKQLPLRRSQLLLAVSGTLSGGLTGFLGSGFIAASPDDPSNIAYYHEPFALPGGALAALLSAYLQAPTSGDAQGRAGLGLTASQAATQMTALFASAATQTIGT